MASPGWRYYLDFVLYPALAVILFALFCRSWAFVAWAAWGVVLFTAVEYWTHRTLLHVFFYHGTHEQHHTHPSEYVVFPLWYVPMIFIAFFVVLPVSVFAGFTLGYCWFIVLHHALHHWSLRKATWLHGYAKWHSLHHLQNDCNFGITTNVWDRLFGTYRLVRA